jgi:putative membrane protein
MTKITAIAASLLLAGASCAVAAQTKTSAATAKPAATQTKIDTATFVKKVASANQFEIDSSKLAQDKASAADVKEFAALMIKDHTKAGEDFKAALSQGQTTSAMAPEPAGKDAADLKELQGLSGDQFQAKYIAMQAKAHKDAVALFGNYAQSGDDPALKEFAKKTLPVLQMHDQHVKELQAAHKA